MEILFISSFSPNPEIFSKFDTENVILFQIKVFNRNNKRTTLGKCFVKVTAYLMWLRVIRQINRILKILKYKIFYKYSVVSPSYLNLLAFSFAFEVDFFYSLEVNFDFAFEVGLGPEVVLYILSRCCQDMFSVPSTFLYLAGSFMSLMLRFSIYILPQKIISKEKSWFLKFEKSSILLNVFSVFLKV